MSEAKPAVKENAGNVIRAAELGRVDRWTTPAVADDGRSPSGGRGSQGLSLRELEHIQKEAYDEAFAQGLEEGRAQGALQVEEQARHLTALLDQLAQPFRDLDECVEQQTVQLAMIVVRKLFRRELKTAPSSIVGVVRKALAALPVATRDVRVYLHPQDAELVNKAVQKTDGERAWQTVEDPLLTRGGCRIESATSRIDASVEARLAKIASAIVGDERAHRRPTCD